MDRHVVPACTIRHGQAGSANVCYERRMPMCYAMLSGGTNRAGELGRRSIQEHLNGDVLTSLFLT